MNPITSFSSRIAPLPIDNIDTDQIIPARFLKTTDKSGLGRNLFCDWRYDAEGNPRPDFILNQPRAAGAAVLLAGDNFGCGSSREHAPWALLAFGFRAIISTSFADIFRNNCLKNGLLPIVVDAGTHAELLEIAGSNPAAEVHVDLATQSLRLPSGRTVQFPIDSFSKHCLLNGVDQLGYLLQKEALIAAYERAYPPRITTYTRE
ncbi:MAG TPA: 3-isopropylmalate dehydratase small subunit [Bryobacterales bacterium]|jgi:3-isopropylmalate/(R)-2-methylmalate dehydratase small subunit|nr:3-isopropylmalate dehydratase small subunit [Bryobacterales bacterium]